MKTVEEVEEYVRTTYLSILREPDPDVGGVRLRHPFKKALIEAALILANPHTTSHTLLTHLRRAWQAVGEWVYTPQEYKKELLLSYQRIIDYIEENPPMTHTGQTWETQELIRWIVNTPTLAEELKGKNAQEIRAAIMDYSVAPEEFYRQFYATPGEYAQVDWQDIADRIKKRDD